MSATPCGPLPPDCRLYADGGVVFVNPSPHGGTWSFCFVDEAGERLLAGESGLVLPASMGLKTVENNVTELLACVEGLERAPGGWSGVLYSDSQNTIRRLTAKHASWGGVPPCLYQRAEAVRKKFPKLRAVLLDGHPTRQHLKEGRGKRGNPASIWNVRCDAECKRQARPVIEELNSIRL